MAMALGCQGHPFEYSTTWMQGRKEGRLTACGNLNTAKYNQTRKSWPPFVIFEHQKMRGGGANTANRIFGEARGWAANNF